MIFNFEKILFADDIFESLYETLAIHKSLFSVINRETIQLNKFRAFNLDFYESKLKGLLYLIDFLQF